MTQPTTADIRQHLFAACPDEELTALCADHFPAVHANFTLGMTKTQKIQLLLDHCDRHNLLADLLALLPPALTASDADHEQAYLAFVRDECRYLDSEGVDRRRAELTGVFVMLQALERPPAPPPADISPTDARTAEMGLPDRAAEHLRGRAKSRRPDAPPPPVPLAQALRQHPHLVLLGEPGAGKTTALQYLALCFATPDMATHELGLAEPRIPLRIPLRAGYDGRERLDAYLLGQLDRAYVLDHVARVWLTQGRLILLLDGLDEVAENQRRDVQTAIARFAATDAGRRTRIVLTSRIAGYASDALRAAGHYTVQPFAGADDALPYIRGWLRALKGDLAADAAATDADAEHLLAHLQGHKQITTNPLLLRLAIAVYVETGAPPPDRAALYERYLRDVAWPRAQAREPAYSEAYPAIQSALEAVAWRLQIAAESLAADLAPLVEAELPRKAGCRAPLDYLRECLGILAEYPDAQGRPCLAFRHLTFREYFVACRLARAWRADPKRAFAFLHPRLHHPAWREPLLLLAAMLDEPAAAVLVRAIWKAARSPYEWELNRDLMLAADVAASARALRADLLNDLARAVVTLWLDVEVKWLHRLALPLVLFIGLLVIAIRFFPSAASLVALAALGLLLVRRILLFIQELISVFRDWESTRWIDTILDLRFFRQLRSSLALPERLSGKARYANLNESLARTAATLGGPCAPRLIRGLKAYSWVVRRAAAAALGRIGGPVAVGPLLAALADPDWTVRRAAAAALGQIGDSAAVGSLVAALADPDLDVRLLAAEVLGQIGDPAAVGPLVATLADSERHMRQAAADALGQIGDPAAVGLLVAALADPYLAMRTAAARALGQIGDPAAVGPLVAALADPDSDVRKAAADALGRIGDPAAVGPLFAAWTDPDWGVSWAALGALRRIGLPAVGPLVAALADPDLDVRRAAANALGQIGDPAAVDPPIATLADSDSVVRTSVSIVMWMMGQIGTPAAVGPLVAALADPEPGMRGAAADALNQTAPNIPTIPLTRTAMRRLWWLLTDASLTDPEKGPQVADVAFTSLKRLAARLSELEVHDLGDRPPLFAPSVASPSPALPVLIVLSTVAAALSGIASNIIAAYLQDHFQLITDTARLALVGGIFALTLLAGALLTLRLTRRSD